MDVVGDLPCMHVLTTAPCPPPSGTDGRRLSAFVVPNAHVPGHPDLDSFVVPVEEVERRSGLRFFGTLPDRTRIPPLCGPERRCGLGVARLDGLIRSNKSLGTLASATDCEGLELAMSSALLGGIRITPAAHVPAENVKLQSDAAVHMHGS